MRGLLVAIFLFPAVASAQLTVQGGFTGAQLVQTLLGGGVNASNITLNCPGTSAGTFNGTNSNIGLPGGVLLTSGSINVAPGPNNSGSAGVSNNAAGDPQLTAQAGFVTYDACVLEFDLTPMCDTIEIRYVFGSDEYPEFVGTGFNDAFGFFISGPGITGTQNIAKIPGTQTTVTINNVNQNLNSQYYVTNTGSTVQYDGFTTPLQALAVVIPCSTYHLKLAIADAGDHIYDSGVFLENGGIGCISQQITLNASSNSISGQPYAVEGCVDALFYVKRQGNLSQPHTLNFNVGGTATNGVDMNTIPSQVTFPVGVDSVGIPIQAVDDGITEGLEQIYITITDTICQTVFTDSAVIVISDPPEAGFGATTECEGTATQFSDSSSFALGPIFSWFWDFDDGGATAAMKTPTHTFSGPGTYNVTQIVTTADGCTDTITQPVVVNAVPTSGFSHAGHCHTHPVQFTDASNVASGYTISGWNWNFGDTQSSTQQSPSHTYGSPGTYNVTLITTEAAGCSDTIVQPVTIYPLPAPDFNATTVCLGNMTTFNDNSSIGTGTINNWSWAFGDGNTSSNVNPTNLYNSWGTYNVQLILTSDTGCIDSITKPITVNPIPFADFGYTGHCHTHPTFFTDSSTASPGATVTNWTWDFGDATTSTQQNPAHTYAGPGTYQVTVISAAQGGCEDTITLPVTIHPLPQVNFDHTEVCEGDTTFFSDLTQIITGSVASWDWDFGDGGGNSAQANPFHIYGSWGTYAVGLEITSDQGCIDSTRISIDVNPNPVPSFTSNRPCWPDTTFFNDSSLVAKGIITNWNWDLGDGNTVTGPSPYHVYGAAGTYAVTLTVTSDEGCITSILDETTVTPPAFTPDPIGDTVCPGYGAQLLSGAHPGNITMLWFNDPTHETPDYTGPIYFTPPIIWTKTWWVQARDQFGCLSAKIPVSAASFGYIGGKLAVSAREVEVPNAIVEFEFIGSVKEIVSWQWDFGDGTTSNDPSPVHQYQKPGWYTITLTVVDEDGCVETATYEEYIEVTETIRLYIPNAFTPNGDGKNDKFSIEHRLITDIHIQIFDRWGKLHYESFNLMFEWDGTDVNGELLPEGVYTYSIQATAYNGNVVKKAGSITLIK